jgi:hypothetical protein
VINNNIKFKFKFKMLLSSNNTVCDNYANYTNKHVTWLLNELRSSFLNILNNENQIFNNLSESEKLSYILNPSTPSQVNVLGSFFKKVIRTEDRRLLTCLLENVDVMFSLLHVYLCNLHNCHKLYC